MLFIFHVLRFLFLNILISFSHHLINYTFTTVQQWLSFMACGHLRVTKILSGTHQINEILFFSRLDTCTDGTKTMSTMWISWGPRYDL